MKVKLQPASATDLPPFNPILPSAAITQVMLVANPQNVSSARSFKPLSVRTLSHSLDFSCFQEKIRIKFKILYKCNDSAESDMGDIDVV